MGYLYIDGRIILNGYAHVYYVEVSGQVHILAALEEEIRMSEIEGSKLLSLYAGRSSNLQSTACLILVKLATPEMDRIIQRWMVGLLTDGELQMV